MAYQLGMSDIANAIRALQATGVETRYIYTTDVLCERVSGLVAALYGEGTVFGPVTPPTVLVDRYVPEDQIIFMPITLEAQLHKDAEWAVRMGFDIGED